MKRIGSILLIFMMLITMIPTAFADVTTGYSGVSALSALFLSADLQDVFGAYDTALEFIGDPTAFYSGSPVDLRNAISAELDEATFNDLYDETRVALDGESQGSKSEVYDDLAGVVSGQAQSLVQSINSMDLTPDDGSKVGTVVYYLGKLAQEKKIATYDSYTDKLEFDLGRIPGSTTINVNDGQRMYFGSSSDTYQLAEAFEAIFTNAGPGFDFDGVMGDLESYLNDELAVFIAADDANLQRMVDALSSFGFLHTYSTKPSSGGGTGGGGGGFVIPIPTPEPAPEDPGVIDQEAIEVETTGTVTQVSVDGDAIETAVEQAQVASEGTTVLILIPETALPTEVSEQVVVVIPLAAIEAIAEGGIDVELNFNGVQLIIPAETFEGQIGELGLQIILKAPPTSLEAAIDDPGLRQVSVTRGLVPSFDINAVMTRNDGQTRLTDHSSSPLHFEYPLDGILTVYYDTLGLYYYNPKTGLYEYVSGTVKDGKLIADLTHLSEYAILNVVTNFNDMTNHWADRYVKSMAAKHVVNGVGNGKYNPEASVTRAEFVKMLVGVKDVPLNGAPSFYTDVNDADWFKPYVDAAYANGLVYGGTTSSFMPDQTATRLEMMMMLSYAIDDEITKEEAEEILSKFADQEEVAELHRMDIAKVVKAGLITGSDGKLLLEDGLKRSEAATVMYRLFNK